MTSDDEAVRLDPTSLWPIACVSPFMRTVAQRRAGEDIDARLARRRRRYARNPPEVCQVCLGEGVRVVWTFSPNGRGFGREIPCPSCMGRKGDGAFGVLHPVG